MKLDDICVYLNFDRQKKIILESCITHYSSKPCLPSKIVKLFKESRNENLWDKTKQVLATSLRPILKNHFGSKNSETFEKMIENVSEFIIRYFVTISSDKQLSKYSLKKQFWNDPKLAFIDFEEILDRASFGEGDDMPELNREKMIEFLRHEYANVKTTIKNLKESDQKEYTAQSVSDFEKICSNSFFNESQLDQFTDKEIYSFIKALRQELKAAEKLIEELAIFDVMISKSSCA